MNGANCIILEVTIEGWRAQALATGPGEGVCEIMLCPPRGTPFYIQTKVADEDIRGLFKLLRALMEVWVVYTT